MAKPKASTKSKTKSLDKLSDLKTQRRNINKHIKTKASIPTEKGKSKLTPTFPDRPIGYGNPPRETQIKTGEVRNPGGRPKIISKAYLKWLETVNPRDPEGRTNAELAAVAMGGQVLQGNVGAAREIRAATEGEKTRTIEDDIIDYLREGKLTPAQVTEALPEDAPRLIAAAGLTSTQDPGTGEAQTTGGTAPSPGHDG